MTRALKLLSWNVNGARAAAKKGAFGWLLAERPFLCGFQETKARKEQLAPEFADPEGYASFWNHAERPGYSGTAAFALERPLSARFGFGQPRFDSEGRVVLLEYPSFHFMTVYFPNGGSGPERLAYKLDFYAAFLDCAARLMKTGKTLVVCGDVNTAHAPIDLARPKENAGVSGFLPQERQWLDRFEKAGLADTFRELHPAQAGKYSWWDMKTRARERNVGWRIDYFFIDRPSLPRVREAFIMDTVQGSDHCPVGILLED